MEARFASAVLVRSIVDTVKEITSEVNLEFEADGIHLQAMDSNHISLVSMHIVVDDLVQYRCETATVVGVRMSTLSSMLKCIDHDGFLTLHLSDKQPDVLEILFEDTKRAHTSRWTLRLLDISTDAFTIPAVQYTTTVSMPTLAFQRLFRSMASIADTCSVRVTSSASVAWSATGDHGTCEETFAVSEICTIASSAPYEAAYALRHLLLFSKNEIAPWATLKLLDDTPLTFEQTILRGSVLRFFLAPKMAE